MTYGHISTPLSELDDHYEIVVIGSGYGGAVTASRLARAGRNVCLFERGRELVPGEYPDKLLEAAEHVQIERNGKHSGDRSALYQFHFDGDVGVYKGCGLGGTSLVNASVSLRPDAAVFATGWPEAVAKDREGLDRGFELARDMLAPTPYPADFPPLAKLEVLESLKGEHRFERTPINVTFEDGPNAVGVTQQACNGCGDCITGCNYGAKNTLLMNYLPDAVKHGASVFCEIEVRNLERHDDGWHVLYQPLDLGREHFAHPPLTVRADIVVLAGGTLGSTEILLRSAQAGLSVSDRLGERFTGNGDVLAFAYNSDVEVNGIGSGDKLPDPNRPAGPCITGVIVAEDPDDEKKSYIVEEGVIPGALAPILPVGFEASDVLVGRRTGRWFHKLVQFVKSLFGGAHEGADEDTLTYLVMGHDDDGGSMHLTDDSLRLKWEGAGTTPYYEERNRDLAAMSMQIGADYVPEPLWAKEFGHTVVTVHPLGGCVMADEAGLGVVDERGRVFAGNSGSDVYDDLYVADGSIIPRPLGVNPLLTITALAERNAALIAEDRGWEIDYSPDASPPPNLTQTTRGIEFTEQMAGWFDADPAGSYEDAEERGKKADSPARFDLTISTDDAETFLENLGQSWTAVGTVQVDALSAEPMTVTHGEFQLVVKDPTHVETQNMRYHLPCETTDGRRYFLQGFKVLHHRALTSLWHDSTTLFASIHEGVDDSGPVVGRAVLHISVGDFAKQLSTVKVTGPGTKLEKLETEAAFGKHFAGVLFDDYGGVFSPVTKLHRDAPPRTRRPLRCGPPEIHWMKTPDGAHIRLARYKGGSRGPVVMVPGMGANSGLFSTDTFDENMLEYLYTNGFDCWLFDWRGSPMSVTSTTSWNGDTVALQDYPTAVAKIRELTGADEVHWVVHCVGSITFFMAALAGLESIGSVVALQVATNPVAPLMTRLKISFKLPQLLPALGVHFLTADSYYEESRGAKAFDFLLRLWPMPKGERCSSAVCHRITFLYSLCWDHAQLNDLTHTSMHEIFGIANLEMMKHLALCAKNERLVGASGEDIYMPHLDRLDLPITFLHGADNRVWKPASTLESFDLMREHFGDRQYHRTVFADYGHLDPVIGRNANVDCYPQVLAHFDRIGV